MTPMMSTGVVNGAATEIPKIPPAIFKELPIHPPNNPPAILPIHLPLLPLVKTIKLEQCGH